MKIVILIVQILLALAFLMAGVMKLMTPYEELMAAENMGWVGDFSSTQIIIIGVLELLGGLGLIIPLFIKKLRALIPLAALGLAMTMVGAMVTHIGRGEPVYTNIVLLILALLTFWWRRSYFKS